MLDIDDYPDGTDRVLVGLSELAERFERGENSEFEDHATRSELADHLGEEKEWVRYRLDRLSEGRQILSVAYDEDDKPGAAPTKLYQLGAGGEKWMNAQTELENIFEEIPGSVRTHHLRVVSGEINTMRLEIRRLRKIVEGE